MLPNQRAFHRVRYPDTARPLFLSGEASHTYPVIDVSEAGVRFHTVSTAPEALPQVGERLSGYIRFRSGPVARLCGEVVRVREGEIAVRLNECRIPFATILEEQLFLRARALSQRDRPGLLPG